MFDTKRIINYRIIKAITRLAKENLQVFKRSDKIKTLIDAWEKAIDEELKKVMERSCMVLEEKKHPLASLIRLIPAMVRHPVVCNSTAFFLMNIFSKSIFSLRPKFAEILLEEIPRRE